MFLFAQTLMAGCPSVAVDLSAGESMPESTWESSQMNMKMFRRYAMRAGVVALCSAALCAVPMMAQGGGGAPGGGGGRGGRTPDAQLAQLVTPLTLTAAQQAKIKPILEADAAKI